MQRLSMLYSGRVQGVGFRAAARAVAADCGVVGWVRNEPDGSVRCVVEGEQHELASFTDQLAAVMGARIDHVAVERSAASGEFMRFEIRR